jgi:hypothetical protein
MLNLNQESLKRLQEKSYIWQESVDIVLGVISANIVSMFMLLGTVIIALVPAIFTGYAVYSITLDVWGFGLSFFTGLAFAIGLEAVGMTTSNVALHLYRSWRRGVGMVEEFIIAASLMLVYVVIVCLVVVFVESLEPTLKAIGVASPFLAVILYIARGLYLDHKQEESQSRIEAKEYQLQQEKISVLKIEQDQALKILELEQKQELKLLRLKQSVSKNLPELSAPLPELSAPLPEWLDEQPESKAHFLELVQAGKIRLNSGLTGKKMLQHIEIVKTDKTGRNWLASARNMNGHTPT